MELGLCRGLRSRRANDLPGMARSKERRADVLDQFDNVIRLVCSAANMIAKSVWRVPAIVVTKDQSGDRKTISRPVSETESKLALIRNANHWASERKSH
jgi:hypothetical protein